MKYCKWSIFKNQLRYQLTSVRIPLLVGGYKVTIKRDFVRTCFELDTRGIRSFQDPINIWRSRTHWVMLIGIYP